MRDLECDVTGFLRSSKGIIEPPTSSIVSSVITFTL